MPGPLWTGEAKKQEPSPPSVRPPPRLTQEQKDDYFLLHGEEPPAPEAPAPRAGPRGDEVTLSRAELSVLVEEAVAKALEKERKKGRAKEQQRRQPNQKPQTAPTTSLVAPAPPSSQVRAELREQLVANTVLTL